ncbi:MAG: hypothetical protein ABIQ74_11825 [Chitinophagales bacterium]
MRKIFCIIFLLCTVICRYLPGQEVLISQPEKITAGISKVEVLGRNNHGILVRHTVKDQEGIQCFYDNMSLRWKKTIQQRERNSNLEEVIMYPDSLLFFYTVVVKNLTLLKAYKTSDRIESSSRLVVCDTLSKTLLSPTPKTYFSTSPDKRYILFWFTDHNFNDNQLLHVSCINLTLNKLWSTSLRITGLAHPEVLTALPDSMGNACIISGDFKAKNFNNNFPYASLMISSIKEKGLKVHQQNITQQETLYTSCEARPDFKNGNVAIAGLFAHNAGTESEGSYFMLFNMRMDSLLVQRYDGFSTDLLSQLTGNAPPKKNDGFYDFQPKELIVKRDGGAIFIAEAQSITSEAYNTPPFGSFGLSTGFTVNYYHYDDLAVTSFRLDGTVEWKQILHKKQGTEGDGGFYSSIATMIAQAQLFLIYNDAVNGQTSVADYAINADGYQQRNDLFSADRKGVSLALRQAKQISATEIVIPSFKRNYLQFVKINFAP